ncbi:hypothetical protein ACLMJK_002183 [Lecanora helva]
MPSQTHGKMKWSLEADQKDLKIKLNFEELSRAMGPGTFSQSSLVLYGLATELCSRVTSIDSTLHCLYVCE